MNAGKQQQKSSATDITAEHEQIVSTVITGLLYVCSDVDFVS